MAFGDGIEATYSIEDAKGKVTSFGINFPETADVPTLLNNFIPTTAEIIDNFVGGKFVSAGATINVNLDGVVIKDSPILGSDIEEGAFFSFRSDAGAPTSFRIPTFDEQFGLETGDSVDTSAAPVQAFIDLIIDGYTFGIINVPWSDSHGNNVVGFTKAKDAFRKSRKR
jgi:hypothetical protein